MSRAGSESPDPFDALTELANHYGWTPWFQLDVREHPGEIMAHFSAAPAFVNAMIAQAELLHQAGNRIGVQAAMIEAHSWIEHLTRTFTWEDMPDEDRQDTGLQRGLHRMNEAAQRYASLLAEQHPTDDRGLMALWRATILPAGYAAALDYHVTRLTEENDRKVQEQHNAAVRVSVITLEHAAQELQQIRNVSTTGPRPSNRQMRRCLGLASAAITRCEEIAEIMDSTVPVTLNVDIATDERLAQEGRELGEHLRTHESDYAIMENAGRPDHSLIAYHNHGGIRVKRIVDCYEDETNVETAIRHAASFMAIADEMIENDQENAATLQSIARLVYDNALAGLHHVDRLDFALFMEALRTINDDPIRLRDAALTALSEEYNGAELLLAMGANEEDAVSKRQAFAVIAAGRNAGMSEGQLRALAAAMEHHPSELGLQPPKATAEQIVDVLERCPEPLNHHQMLKIVHAMGGDPNDAAIITWAQDNCYYALEDEQTDDQV